MFTEMAIDRPIKYVLCMSAGRNACIDEKIMYSHRCFSLLAHPAVNFDHMPAIMIIFIN